MLPAPPLLLLVSVALLTGAATLAGPSEPPLTAAPFWIRGDGPGQSRGGVGGQPEGGRQERAESCGAASRIVGLVRRGWNNSWDAVPGGEAPPVLGGQPLAPSHQEHPSAICSPCWQDWNATLPPQDSQQ